MLYQQRNSNQRNNENGKRCKRGSLKCLLILPKYLFISFKLNNFIVKYCYCKCKFYCMVMQVAINDGLQLHGRQPNKGHEGGFMAVDR